MLDYYVRIYLGEKYTSSQIWYGHTLHARHGLMLEQLDWERPDFCEFIDGLDIR